MKSEAILNAIALLKENPQVSDYKINVRKTESFQLFYVKGKLETVRSTDTCDRQVTVYADHDGCRGDAVFYIYPSTTARDLEGKIAEAVRSALLIRNAPYSLPEAETADTRLPTNLDQDSMQEIAREIAEATFAANTHKDGSLNSVEVFLNRHLDSVCNSRGLAKSQERWTAMVEAIPTFNGDRESVELYEQYNFSAYSRADLMAEIAEKMDAVKARYEAVKPDFPMDCKVVLHRQELNDLFSSIAGDLNYATVYSHGNLYHKGDRIQNTPTGDAINLKMKGFQEGNVSSASFDGDGLSLGEITLIKDGTVENYYGSNRFGQYLGEKPTGNLGCICVEPGTFTGVKGEPWLEVLSMSGLQVDFFNDYIGGEIRLACYHDGEKSLPVTGISISGKLQEVLNHMELSAEPGTYDGYTGPASAVFDNMKIF